MPCWPRRVGLAAAACATSAVAAPASAGARPPAPATLSSIRAAKGRSSAGCSRVRQSSRNSINPVSASAFIFSAALTRAGLRF
ncbi:MAG: hypothetical protein FJ051_04505, partial [Cyanobacteria bacterium M_surface_9_m1_291]|nr:hypothetical protein [Cyanobacteria bacterium M_surface_9_m1_291]